MEHSPRGGKRIAFFGGSFDPPHLGHLAVARAARAALGLDTVLFAPVGVQPLKPQGSTAGFAERLAMTRLAIAGEPGFAVSLMDAPKSGAGPNYTIDSLLHLRAELPSDGALYCLMGADSFLSLRRWHRAAEIAFVAALIVASRPGQPLDDLVAALPQGLHLEAASLPPPSGPAPPGSGVDLRSYLLRNPAGDTAPLYLLPGLHIDISASQIRDQIREQTQSSPESAAPEPELLPSAVLDYIRTHGLYR
ncbi:MAG: nicotinate (nicotinamide) nucleotide adenylyltransferase [Terracidiphilus sp.]|nr:nicotinate (nicotinamide) nucleotide adenylyltransferase [Terracidiphilus sp.]